MVDLRLPSEGFSALFKVVIDIRKIFAGPQILVYDLVHLSLGLLVLLLYLTREIGDTRGRALPVLVGWMSELALVLITWHARDSVLKKIPPVHNKVTSRSSILQSSSCIVLSSGPAAVSTLLEYALGIAILRDMLLQKLNFAAVVSWDDSWL